MLTGPLGAVGTQRRFPEQCPLAGGGAGWAAAVGHEVGLCQRAMGSWKVPGRGNGEGRRARRVVGVSGQEGRQSAPACAEAD